jgi:hypothetical protein
VVAVRPGNQEYRMNYSQRSPLWPYLLVLGGLFALSLAIPHRWKSDTYSSAASVRKPLARSQPHRTAQNTAPAVAIIRPAQEALAGPVVLAAIASSAPEQAPSDVWSSAAASELAPRSAPSVDYTVGAIAQRAVQKFADFRRYVAEQSEAAESDGFTPQQPESVSDQATAHRSRQTDSLINTANCAPPTSLLAQLDALAQYPDCQAWSGGAKDLILDLCRTPAGSSRQSAEIVEDLQALVLRADDLSGQLKDLRAAESLRRARYALQRRLLIWPVLFNNDLHSVYANSKGGEDSRRKLSQALADAGSHLQTGPNSEAWRKYLLLDQVAQLANATQLASPDEARQLARQVINRLTAPQASDGQRQVLGDASLQSLVEAIRPWASETSDVRAVLAALEQYEASELTSDGRALVVLSRRLNWSPEEKERQLARELDLHYRNANIRIVLTADLINRVAPDPPATTAVVNDTILNSRVNGSSQTTAQLQVKLIPDPLRLHFQVGAEGSVNSLTQSTRGPVTFSNRGESTFVARKTVILDRDGWTSENASAEASSDTQLLGVRTTLDGRPVLGSVARRRAVEKEEALREVADREVDEKIEAKARQRLDDEVDRRLTFIQQALREQLLEPLAALRITPEPIALETTAQRLTARLRLAGAIQAAGHTARPQAPSDSLASIQIHESAINNLLDSLQLAGRTLTFAELFKYVADRANCPMIELPKNLPFDAVITFAESDPVRVRCAGGKLWLTLAAKELRRGDTRWQDIVASVAYQPQIDGLHVRLVRSGPAELERDNNPQADAALREVFGKLLSPDRTLNLIPPIVAEHPQLADASVTQCVIDDGWIGLAIGPNRNVVQSPGKAGMVR